MISQEKITAVGTELIARVGKQRARVVIRAAQETMANLIAQHGEEIASQVAATIAVLVDLNPKHPRSRGRINL